MIKTIQDLESAARLADLEYRDACEELKRMQDDVRRLERQRWQANEAVRLAKLAERAS